MIWKISGKVHGRMAGTKHGASDKGSDTALHFVALGPTYSALDRSDTPLNEVVSFLPDHLSGKSAVWVLGLITQPWRPPFPLKRGSARSNLRSVGSGWALPVQAVLPKHSAPDKVSKTALRFGALGPTDSAFDRSDTPLNEVVLFLPDQSSGKCSVFGTVLLTQPWRKLQFGSAKHAAGQPKYDCCAK